MEIIQIQKRCQVEKINYEARKSALFKVELKFAYEKYLRKGAVISRLKVYLHVPGFSLHLLLILFIIIKFLFSYSL